jgi:pSer/pThr/pTyr-binding forkhead associated (FHA) protein
LDGRTFKITDNNSTSGTRVNGRRIQPNDPVELHDGDEIVLGDLAKLGVKLKFGFMMDKTQLQSSGTASDKTFIMDDFDRDDWDKYKDN